MVRRDSALVSRPRYTRYGFVSALKATGAKTACGCTSSAESVLAGSF
jgi:hypothetical protein